MDRPVKVAAVMYDPKVSVIWEIIRDFFESQGVPIDVSFYSTYESQVTAD
jgi:phosphonate transport system substrate-binding protein